MAAWPLAARAQQSARPVIGYLSTQAIAARPRYLAAFRTGLATEGFVEGQNLTIEYRAADGKPERLPELAADLVRRQVALIASSGGPPAALAAKRATETIPIVFASGGDPVQLGLVSSFRRPGGNLTGLYFLLAELVGKRLALMHELIPRAKRIAVLVNPTNAAEAEPTVRNASAAGRELGLDTSTPARAARSRRPSRPSRAGAPMPCSWVLTRPSRPRAPNWCRWRNATCFPLPTSVAILSRLAA